MKEVFILVIVACVVLLSYWLLSQGTKPKQPTKRPVGRPRKVKK